MYAAPINRLSIIPLIRTMFKLDQDAVSLSTLMFGATLMNQVFNFFYVKLFLNNYNITESWFQLAQTIFLVWNAINDPLFGYIQDHGRWKIVRSRRHAIYYGALPFVVSFLLPWFQWGSSAWIVGLHLVVSLCLYDAMFTFVLLSHCSLFTEMSRVHEKRLRFVRYLNFASLLGSGGVFACNYASNNLQSLHNFQIVAVFIAAVSFVSIWYTGKYAYTEYDRQTTAESTITAGEDENVGCGVAQAKSQFSAFRLTFQILSERNFVAFVLMNFGQYVNHAFYDNFLTIFLDLMFPYDMLSVAVKSLILVIPGFIPQIINIVWTPFVGYVGYYLVIQYSIILRILIGCSLYIVGQNSYYFMLGLMLLDSVTGKAVFSLFNLAVSDIADEDMQRYSRRHPVTSMIFGTNALIVKPAQSLTPMFVVWWLNQYGYEGWKSFVAQQTADSTPPPTSSSLLPTAGFLNTLELQMPFN